MLANATGVVRFDHIQEKLGQIWNMCELTRSAIVSAEAGSFEDEGGVCAGTDLTTDLGEMQCQRFAVGGRQNKGGKPPNALPSRHFLCSTTGRFYRLACFAHQARHF